MKSFKSETLGVVTAAKVGDLSRAELCGLYNEITGKSIKAFASQGKGVEAVTKLFETAAEPKTVTRVFAGGHVAKVPAPEVETTKRAPKAAKETAKKSASAEGGRGPKPRYSDNQTVTLLVEENPKRAGSGAAARFAKYKNGMTVAAALKAGIRRDDIAWDVKHGFVQVND